MQVVTLRPSPSERYAQRQTSAQQRRPGIDPAYRALVAKLPCAVCYERSRVDPHHLKAGPAALERAFGCPAGQQNATVRMIDDAIAAFTKRGNTLSVEGT